MIWLQEMLIKMSNSREPWSSGYGSRLMFKRLWVQMPAVVTWWTLIQINEKEAGNWTFKKMFNGHLAEKSRVQMKVVPSIILCTKFSLFQNDPIPNTFLCIVVLFSSQFKYKLKKRRCCAWVSNPGPWDGRHREIP